jgi:hypothetical protein
VPRRVAAWAEGERLTDLLQLGHVHGGTAIALQGGLLGGLFIAGLIGSATHCVGMCGPFVLAQMGERLRHLPASRLTGFHRLSGGALLPYHLGRATTYVGLGALAALLADRLVNLTGLRWLAPILLLLAAAVFLLQGLGRFGLRLPRGAAGTGIWPRRITAAARPLFAAPTGWRAYALGILLGFLPCGLLYGAVAAAAATADPLAGAAAMGAFVLGTVPALVAVGCLGWAATGRWPAAAQSLAAAVMLLNAGLLTAAALSWLA